MTRPRTWALPLQTTVERFKISTRKLPGPDACGRTFETVIIRDGEYLDETEERTSSEEEALRVHAMLVRALRLLP